jgi:WD40 repeat protein
LQPYGIRNLAAAAQDERAVTLVPGRLVVTMASDVSLSTTDVNLYLLQGAAGNTIAAQDVSVGPNGKVEYVVPAAGVYRIRVSNLGPGIVYTSLITPTQPDRATVEKDPDPKKTDSPAVPVNSGNAPVFQPKFVLEQKSPVSAVAFSPDGKVIASAGGDGAILWDVATRQPRFRLEHDVGNPETGITRASGIAFSPKTSIVAVSGGKGRVFFFDSQKGSIQGRLDPPKLPVTGIEYSADGTYLVLQIDYSSVFVYNLKTAAAAPSEISLKGHRISGFALSGDSKSLVGHTGNRLVVWDLLTNTSREMDPPDKLFTDFNALACSPLGPLFATSSGFGKTRIYNLATLKETTVIKIKTPVECLSFSPNGKWLAVGPGPNLEEPLGKMKFPVTLWDVSTGDLVAAFEGAQGKVRIAFSSDSRTMAAASLDNKVYVWDLSPLAK